MLSGKYCVLSQQCTGYVVSGKDCVLSQQCTGYVVSGKYSHTSVPDSSFYAAPRVHKWVSEHEVNYSAFNLRN